MFERRREGEVQSVVTHVRVLAAATHVDVRLVPVVLANDGTAQRHQRFGVKAPKGSFINDVTHLQVTIL